MNEYAMYAISCNRQNINDIDFQLKTLLAYTYVLVEYAICMHIY